MRNFYSSLLFLFVFVSEILIAQVCPTLTDNNGIQDNININCSYISSNKCLDLKANNFNPINDTGNYGVSSLAYAPQLPYNSGTAVGIYEDDKYVKRISFNDTSLFGNTPFSFSFYGNSYPSLLISSNSFITFNQLFQENDYSTGDISGHQIPDAYFPSSSVFGVFQDLEFIKDQGSEIYYKVDGVAPCRTLTISFYKGKIVGTDQFITSQIVLHEYSNKIDVFVESKPLPQLTARHRESLIGITGEKSVGIAAPGRNTGIWSASNEGWQFTPNGTLINPTYQWYKDGVLIDLWDFTNVKNVTVCPVNPVEVYTVKANYKLSNGNVISYSKDIKITYDSTYPLTKDFTKTFCSGDNSPVYQSNFYSDLTSNPVANFNFKFYSSNANAIAGGTPNFDPALPLNKSLTYYVRVENKNDPSCYRIAILKLGDPLSALLTTTVQICDANNDGTEKNYQLSNLLCQLFSGLQYTDPKFYIDASTIPVTTADLTTSSKIFVEVNTSCGLVKYGPININFSSGPNVNTITNPVNINLCDVVTNGNSSGIETNFDWKEYFAQNGIIISNDPGVSKITFYVSEDNAKSGSGQLTYISEGIPNAEPALDYVYYVYARVEYPMTNTCFGSCYSVAKIPVRVKFNKIILNVKDKDTDNIPDNPEIFDDEDADIYYCKDGPRNVDLEADSKSIITITNPMNGNGLTITYHNTLAEADDLNNPGISKNQTIPNVVLKSFYIRYRYSNSNCYVIKKLNYDYGQFYVRSTVSLCAGSAGSSITVILANYNNYILEPMFYQNPRPTIEYFSDAAATNAITQITMSGSSVTVYAKVTLGLVPGCSEVFPVVFSPRTTPELLKSSITIYSYCDNNNDGVEYYDLTTLESQIIDLSTGPYTIEYFKNFNAVNNTLSGFIPRSLAQRYTLTDGGKVYVAFHKDGCYSKAEINFSVNLQKTIELINDIDVALIQCNITGQVSNFNLNDAIPKLYSFNNPPYAQTIKSVKFYESESDAGKDINAITTPDNYPVYKTQPRKVIWARFETNNGCYSTQEFVLRIIESISFTGGPSNIALCDDNFDGIYSFNLREWLNIQIKNSKPGASFLSDYDATIGATYTFYRNSAPSVPLTPAEEASFVADATNNSIILRADGNGCSTTLNITFSFNPIPVYTFNHPAVCKVGDIIDLTVYESDPQMAGGITYEYYKSENDLINGANKISNPKQYPYEGITPIYAKVIRSTGTCNAKAIINLSIEPVTLKTSQLNINLSCDNNNDGKEIIDLTTYQSQFIDNSMNYTFYYYTADPGSNIYSNQLTATEIQNFSVDKDMTVYVAVVSNTPSKCYAIGTINFKANFQKSVVLNDNVLLIQCNSGASSTFFDLTQAISKLYGTSNTPYSTTVQDVSFFETQADAEKNINAIANKTNYPVSNTLASKIVWARFTTTSGCYSTKAFTLKPINNLAFTNASPTVSLCDDNLDGIYTFDLKNWLSQQLSGSIATSSFLTDYDATLAANYAFYYKITDTTPLTATEEQNFQPKPGTTTSVYLKSTLNNCTAVLKLNFSFTNSTVYAFTHPPICKEGETFNLTMFQQDAQLQPATSFEYYKSQSDLANGVNKITNPSQYAYEGINTIYVKVLMGTSCPVKATISLALKPSPVFSVPSVYYFCEGSSVEIMANVSQIYAAGLKPQTYIWTLPDGTKVTNQYPNSTYNATTAGNYSLTIVADNGCASTVNFAVKAYDAPQIYKLAVEGNKVTVLATSPNKNRKVLYTYDGFGTWQESYIFYNVPAGVRTFYVRYEDNFTEDNCVPKPMSVTILQNMNYITPNGDGYNDTWKVSNIQDIGNGNASVQIFDRYNKLVFQKESNTEIIWDGHYGGRVLPTDTYWYILKLPDGRVLTGWILLKNRD